MEGYGLRVLVADECAENRQLIAQYLAQADYNVHVARDGIEVLRQLNKRRYDVVVTSDELPGLSSLDLVGLAQIVWPELPIVVIAFPESEVAELALRRGAYACLRKPYTSTILLQTIRYAASDPRRVPQLARGG